MLREELGPPARTRFRHSFSLLGRPAYEIHADNSDPNPDDGPDPVVPRTVLAERHRETRESETKKKIESIIKYK